MWQPKGSSGTISIKSNAKKKRVNILGALDFNDLSTTITLTENKCDANQVVEFLGKIRKKYSTQNIVLVVDNAKYNHAKLTKFYAELCDIKLFFLPPYSPNLNLIERLWKFTKKMLVRNKYYEKYSLFLEKTQSFFEKMDSYKEELKTLLTRKFQIIHKD